MASRKVSKPLKVVEVLVPVEPYLFLTCQLKGLFKIPEKSTCPKKVIELLKQNVKIYT
jgi:hypothetical protein